MSGHSHSTNIKHRKDRQDNVRSNLFLKLRKQLEQMIKESGCITERVLAIARKNKFPKDKVIQIEKNIKNKISLDPYESFGPKYIFFKALFGIFFFTLDIYMNREEENIFFKTFSLKRISSESVLNYYKAKYYLKIDFLNVDKEKNAEIESVLLEIFINLPNTNSFDYEQKKDGFNLFSWEKKIILESEYNLNQNLTDYQKQQIRIKKKISWICLSECSLSSVDGSKYYEQLELFLNNKNIAFYNNLTKF